MLFGFFDFQKTGLFVFNLAFHLFSVTVIYIHLLSFLLLLLYSYSPSPSMASFFPFKVNVPESSALFFSFFFCHPFVTTWLLSHIFSLPSPYSPDFTGPFLSPPRKNLMWLLCYLLFGLFLLLFSFKCILSCLLLLSLSISLRGKYCAVVLIPRKLFDKASPALL